MNLHLSGLTTLLQVFDMPESVRFYCEVLGFELVNSSPEIVAAEGRYFHWAMLENNEIELMLNTAYDENERPAARDERRWRGHKDVGLYIFCDDLDRAYADLHALGVHVRPPAVTRYGMRQIELADPDGYLIFLQTRVD